FMERCLSFCELEGAVATVTPRNWWFLSSYEEMRRALLSEKTWHLAASLGEEAWHTFGIRGPRTILLVMYNSAPRSLHRMTVLDASKVPTLDEKAEVLRCGQLQTLSQSDQVRNPDARITLEELSQDVLLEHYADALNGLHGG